MTHVRVVGLPTHRHARQTSRGAFSGDSSGDQETPQCAIEILSKLNWQDPGLPLWKKWPLVQDAESATKQNPKQKAITCDHARPAPPCRARQHQPTLLSQVFSRCLPLIKEDPGSVVEERSHGRIRPTSASSAVGGGCPPGFLIDIGREGFPTPLWVRRRPGSRSRWAGRSRSGRGGCGPGSCSSGWRPSSWRVRRRLLAAYPRRLTGAFRLGYRFGCGNPDSPCAAGTRSRSTVNRQPTSPIYWQM